MNEEKLFNEYSYIIDVILRRFLPSKIHDEDYIQIGKIALWKASLTYDGSTKFETYASRVIRNALVDECRKENRTKRIRDTLSFYQKCSNDNDDDITLEDVIPAPEEKHIDDEGLKKDFSDEERIVLSMKASGYKYREITAKIHLSNFSISKIIHKAKGKVEDSIY